MNVGRWIVAAGVAAGTVAALVPALRQRVLQELPAASVERAERASRKLLRHPELLAQPGPLAPAHAGDPKLQECTACHTLSGGIERERCLACHAEIEERLVAGVGYHGRFLTGRCAECHVDHDGPLVRLDAETFNHRTALFALEGAHATLECEACHAPAADEPPGTRRFLGLAHERCVACHTDPHAGTLTSPERDCLACHDQAAWTGRHLAFRHDRDSAYPLRGAHADVACAACHVPPAPDAPLAAADFTTLGTGCADCHADPHEGALAERACADCHGPEGWTGPALRFDHATMSAFPLDAAHRRADCADCHATKAFRPTPAACADCHVAEAAALAGRVTIAGVEERWTPDPHAARVGCADCHDTSVAEESPAALAAHCARCHTPRHADLHLERTTARARLETRIRAALDREPDPRVRAELGALLRVGSHDHAEVLRRLRALAEG